MKRFSLRLALLSAASCLSVCAEPNDGPVEFVSVKMFFADPGGDDRADGSENAPVFRDILGFESILFDESGQQDGSRCVGL